MEQTKDTSVTGIKASIWQFIVDNFLFGAEPDNFSDDDSFLERGIMDSTGILELIGFIERTYGIQVHDDEMLPENLDSLSNIAHFLQRKTGNGAHKKK